MILSAMTVISSLAAEGGLTGGFIAGPVPVSTVRSTRPEALFPLESYTTISRGCVPVIFALNEVGVWPEPVIPPLITSKPQ